MRLLVCLMVHGTAGEVAPRRRDGGGPENSVPRGAFWFLVCCGDEKTQRIQSTWFIIYIISYIICIYHTTHWNQNCTSPCHRFSRRHNYMEEKLRVDREVVRQCSVPSVLPAWPGNNRQVAFLFMTEDGLDFEVRGLAGLL